MKGQKQLPDDLASDIRETTKNIRRRYALYYITQTERDVSFKELVDRVASWETGLPPSEIDMKTRKSVYNSLYQTHLPTLEERGLISFDRKTKTVSLTDRTKNITLVFHQDTSSVDPWSITYLIFSGTGLVGICLWIMGSLSFSFLLSGILALSAMFLAVISGKMLARYQSISKLNDTMAPDYDIKYDNKSAR